MKIKDVVVLVILLLVVALALVPGNIDAFKRLTLQWPYFTSFCKFALLATFGECLALRIKTGAYWRPGFGVLCRALAWGLLGMGIYLSFTIFVSGAGPVLKSLGVTAPVDAGGAFSLFAVLKAFTISATMNLVWAPILMLLHKISDNHIRHMGGSLRRYLTTRINMAASFREIDWDVMWGFVFKKTIPLFWIPAHTITFLLPPYLRVLFAAALGVVLGVILSFAAQSSRRDGDASGSLRASS